MQHYVDEMMKYVKKRVRTEPDTPAASSKSNRRARSVKPTKKSKKEARTISREQREFLQDIFDKPYLCTKSRATRLGLSADKMNTRKKELIDRECVEQFSVNLGRERGGNVAMLALLPKGYGYLGLEPVLCPENVSWEHWTWQKWICRYENDKGGKAEVEKSKNGIRADVGVCRDGEEYAIEVEMSPKQGVPNVSSDLQAGFDRVVCCCKNTKTATEVKRQLKKSKEYGAVKDRVEVKVLTELELVKELEV
jgi:hypothetical protein